MRSKFVVRLLTEDDRLVAWAEVMASANSEHAMASCPFWPTSKLMFRTESSGIVVKMSIHWCDLNIARMRELDESLEVTLGGPPVLFTFIEPIWLVPGMRDVPLPTVTVGSVTLAPESGSFLGVPGRPGT